MFDGRYDGLWYKSTVLMYKKAQVINVNLGEGGGGGRRGLGEGRRRREGGGGGRDFMRGF